MRRVPTQRFVLGFASLAAMVLAYTVLSNARLFRPEVVPPTQEIAVAFTELVVATMVIPTYHGVRDVLGTYVVAARSLGARRWLLVRKVVLPAAGPAILAGLRYAVAIAWMTAVGAEMLMSENGMGNLIVGGGLWASRTQTKADPAVVIVGIVALAVAGWAMDALARAATVRLTRWVR